MHYYTGGAHPLTVYGKVNAKISVANVKGCSFVVPWILSYAVKIADFSFGNSWRFRNGLWEGVIWGWGKELCREVRW